MRRRLADSPCPAALRARGSHAPKVTTPPNHAGQVQTFSLVYDEQTRTYSEHTSDGFGYRSHATYDLRFGAATSEIDINGARVRRTLDPFGRVLAVFGPYDTSLPALSFEYLPEASPPRAVTLTRASAPADYSGPVPAPITTVTGTDGLARAIQLRKTAAVDGVAGMTTSGSASYDAVAITSRRAAVAALVINPGVAGIVTSAGFEGTAKYAETGSLAAAAESAVASVASSAAGVFFARAANAVVGQTVSSGPSGTAGGTAVPLHAGGSGSTIRANRAAGDASRPRSELN